jgi:hypothetical protein
MSIEHDAKEAERLLRDDTLNKALDGIRQDALENLAVSDVDNRTEILRLQALAAATDALRSELKAMIIRQSMNDTSSFA